MISLFPDTSILKTSSSWSRASLLLFFKAFQQQQRAHGAADNQLIHKGQTITETAAAHQRDQGINPLGHRMHPLTHLHWSTVCYFISVASADGQMECASFSLCRLMQDKKGPSKRRERETAVSNCVGMLPSLYS